MLGVWVKPRSGAGLRRVAGAFLTRNTHELTPGPELLIAGKPQPTGCPMSPGSLGLVESEVV